ncbi:hypothetical protein [Streptomyces sp. TLI_146]|uniref:hypothetical protein n=1 Tax=Streptomyces sp. TLI_146 TaxID=1938858 RepID=UPI0015D588A4|nr:hypothetical protein [Streptomyces sp. TLI_146]
MSVHVRTVVPSEVVMKLGKALATGVAEERPEEVVRDEAPPVPEEVPAEVSVEVTAAR